MLRQQEIYRDINQRAHAAMADMGGRVHGQTKWAKAMTRMGICMETFKDKSTRKLAEMLMEGNNMGVIDCAKSLADYPEADEQAVALTKELQDFQQHCIEQLKKLLG